MGEMLSVKNINVYYGSIHAIKDVSFHVNEGEIVTLIGANGAGKTTTMHAISGLLKLQSGEIDYCGQTISKMEAHKIIRLGLAQVPEGRRVFSGLTVQQNLQMGAYTRRDGKEAIQNDFDMVFDLLPRLKERRNQPAGTLSGGEQQMLAMGRALMCKPKMLLLDEPSMGLSPLLVKEIFKIIRQVNRNGVSLYFVMGMPTERAAISLSRMALMARPARELTRFRMTSSVIMTSTMPMVKVDAFLMPVMPIAPLISTLPSTSRFREAESFSEKCRPWESTPR